MPKGKSSRPRRFPRARGLMRTAVLIMITGSAVAGLGTAGATAQSTTTDVVHLFARYGPSSFVSSSGHVLTTPPQTFAAGDLIESSDTDYVGTHLHHANLATASDHEMCIFSSPKSAACYGQVAIGGSMIFARFALEMSPQSSAQIYGGTGAFRGATGSVHFVDLTPNAVNSNSDITITVSTPRT